MECKSECESEIRSQAQSNKKGGKDAGNGSTDLNGEKTGKQKTGSELKLTGENSGTWAQWTSKAKKARSRNRMPSVSIARMQINMKR